MREASPVTKPIISIRHYCPADAIHTWALFFHTIRQVNIHDYSLKQVMAWAPDEFDLGVWQKKMDKITPFIAEINGVIVGYADLQTDGYIDHFFCHHQYQGLGVARALMEHIFTQGRQAGIERYYSDVSITAQPFYAYLGFHVVKSQEMQIRGESLTNFRMEKRV